MSFTADGTDALPEPEDVAAVCTEVRHRRLPSPFVAVIDSDRGEFPSTSAVTDGGRIAIVLESQAGSVEVGGWDALVEDIEAHRIEIASIE